MRNGTRLAWARQMARLERLGAGRTYEEIGKTIRWLFDGQRGDRYDVVVLSPAALADKWDRIQARRSAPTTASKESPNEFSDYVDDSSRTPATPEERAAAVDAFARGRM